MTDLEQLAHEYQHAQTRADELRTRLAAAIVDSAKAGVRQADIVKQTGYTRERVRQICRAAGIEAE